MARFDLSISPDYLPNWGVWDGVREIIQNGLDEQTQNPEHTFSFRYWPESMRLEVSNAKARLPLEALLIGKTSKANDHRTIGHFGEGLKLGTMALVRQGLHVKVLNQDELWMASLREHPKFKSKVLSFDVAKSARADGVKVVVTGLQPAQWEAMRGKFLALNPASDELRNDSGAILLDDALRGKLFVKGILVSENIGLRYGYDLCELSTNRDRNIVSSEDMGHEISMVWNCLTPDDKNCPLLLDLLLDGSASEFRGIHFGSGCLSLYGGSRWGTSILKEFRIRHGDDSFPATTEAELAKLRHYGRRGVLVPVHHLSFFSIVFGGLTAKLKELSEVPKKIYGLDELRHHERLTLRWATEKLCAVAMPDLGRGIPPVQIVDFNDERIQGLFVRRGEDVMISISRSMLSEPIGTLLVLVHEYCHLFGEDGSHEHVNALQDVWSKLYRQRLDSSELGCMKAA